MQVRCSCTGSGRNGVGGCAGCRAVVRGSRLELRGTGGERAARSALEVDRRSRRHRAAAVPGPTPPGRANPATTPNLVIPSIQAQEEQP